MLEQPRTLFVGITFRVRSEGEAARVLSHLPPNVMLAQCQLADGALLSPAPEYTSRLKKSGSPLAFLHDTLYADDSLPDGAVPHLLAASDAQRPALRQLLTEYRDVFPSKLPKRYPPDRGLGDAHQIPLIDDAQPVKKAMYRHSP